MSISHTFYIQQYNPTGFAGSRNVESAYSCKYVSFTNLYEYGEVKNAYTEDYAEIDGVRVFAPGIYSVARKTTECVLTLFFHGDNCVERSLAFQNHVIGQLVEWHDTFRNVFVTLLMTKSPTVEKERLYGNQKYRLMKYTFTNIHGKFFDNSQITNTARTAQNTQYEEND